MVQLRVTIRPTETRELVVEADSYEQARDEAYAQIPDGWQAIAVRRA